MKSIKAIVFDLDGVMVDTETVSRAAWDAVLKDFKSGLDESLRRRIVGHGSGESAEIIKVQLGLPIAARDLLRLKEKAYSAMLVKGVRVMPGLRALIEMLPRSGLRWAVATASPRDLAEHLLKTIGLFDGCAGVVGGDEVEKNKPAPDVYLLAAQRLDVAPDKCMAIEDSIPGCRAAAAAGMLTVAVPEGEIDRDRFHFADYVFSSLYDVADLVGTINRQNPTGFVGGLP